MSEELIKRLVKRHCEAAPLNSYDFDQNDAITMLTAALSELADALSRPAPAVQVPEGYALVPMMSTSNMDIAGAEAADLEGFDRFKAETVYNFMLAAAPAPATVATEDGAQGWTEQDALNALRFDSDGPFGQDDIDQMLRLMRHIDMLREQKAVAQGGGADTLALLEEYGATCVALGQHVNDEKTASELRASLNKIEMTLRALLSAFPAASGWQPIETAPKDGTSVLLRAKWERDPFIARWIAGEWWPDTTQLGIDGDAIIKSNAPDTDEITHWQLLPSAPAIAKQEKPE